MVTLEQELLFNNIKEKIMGKDVFSFAFITDTHIGANSNPSRGTSDKERLDRAIAYVNENAIDFVIFGGDQITSANDENTNFQLDVLEVFVCLDRPLLWGDWKS